ncbi:MAG TPA: hypothetical protein VEI83_09925 [Acidimicrobiales bacterium]|nr:hypothetical protein [Acidimicrobiales bacterium]
MSRSALLAVRRQRSGAPAPSRRPRRARRSVAIGAGVVVALAGAVAIVVVSQPPAELVPPQCTFGSTAGTPYSITPEQAQNAAIIAAVGYRMGMPDHAVTVALATAFQESALHNLTYGDLDSVGLFQQRPSEGWGTPAQILDPQYASIQFYAHLERVPGWQDMAVTEAAQLVQHSASPDAYAAWESEARALAEALTGEVPAGLTCRLDGFAGAVPASGALAAVADSEFGAAVIGQALPAKTGWRVATWAVAHAQEYHVRAVSFGGRTWDESTGSWGSAAGAGTAAAGGQGVVTMDEQS